MTATALVRDHRALLAGPALLMVAATGWWFDRPSFLAAWLVAWCCCMGIAMGGLSSVWIHTLAGGRWAVPLRPPALGMAAAVPWLSLLFLPVLLGLDALYPWAMPTRDWAAELTAPDFKQAWLRPAPFVARSLLILALWNLLAWAASRPDRRRSVPVAAASLVLYTVSLGIAATDWIMSLTPRWYSSVFGLEIAVGQALGGMAFAVFSACRSNAIAGDQLKRDAGNILLTYVMSWAYLAFCQYLVIWAENLPNEIVWYVQRRGLAWLSLCIATVALQFGLPFLALLFRSVKESASRLGTVAVVLLAGQVLWTAWLILPSVASRANLGHEWWLLPLCLGGMAAVCRAAAMPWNNDRG